PTSRDLLNAIQALSQLSYTPKQNAQNLLPYSVQVISYQKQKCLSISKKKYFAASIILNQFFR
ncbi:MAG: hypothetical protein VB071_03375, partial [Lawsonibacter sp.]|nr:hypothetical protein [Lawsonibacter sp.]